MSEKIKGEKSETLTANIDISNLYLDPNNYRFADEVDYEKYSDDTVTDKRLQRRIRSFIEGPKRKNIKDLLDSFFSNGFLNVDIIQLKDLGNGSYLVMEGNRRVTALKCMKEDYDNGLDIGSLNPDIFSNIPAEIYKKDTKKKDNLITMGLKHISGNKKWPAINQAKLIYDYLEDYFGKPEYSKKEKELCESLGITKSRMRNCQKAIHLINEYKDSDWGDQFNSDMYSIFEETVKKPAIMKWMEWDDVRYTPLDKINRDRFFSWISTDDSINESDTSEPVINKAVEIRSLAEFIDNEEALKAMERSRDVSSGTAKLVSNPKTNIKNSLDTVISEIISIVRLKHTLEEEDYRSIDTICKEIEFLKPKKNTIEIKNKNIQIYYNGSSVKHFSGIFIRNYKKFQDTSIENFNRINIFAGLNNSGKTTILEAVYLLCCQNDFSGIYNIYQIRNKQKELPADFLSGLKKSPVDIEGVFNGYKTSVKMHQYEDSDIDKSDTYLNSYYAAGTIENNQSEMHLHVHERSTGLKYSKIMWLCTSCFSSPYYTRINQTADLYTKSKEEKIDSRTAFDYVLDFIRKIDEKIIDISLVKKNDIYSFAVNSSAFPDRTVDLSDYGDGMVRIFELALHFASCRNGVVLFDEIETAVHYSMLVELTEYIIKMAELFNVQVFLTTHSKECIDAFLEHEECRNKISAYVTGTSDENNVIFVSGKTLKNLSDTISFDLRGGSDNED